MKRVGGDKVQFESRAELGTLLKVLETYKDEHKNEDLTEVNDLYRILDVMEFEW